MKISDIEFNTINRNLVDHYGKLNDKSNFRLVWSDDQLEKRWSNYSLEGFELIHPEVQERYKYKQYIQEKYVLERLIELPNGVETDLVERISYEPIHCFMDSNRNPLRPVWVACKFLTDNLLSGMELSKHYTLNKDSSERMKQEMINEMNAIDESLFGNDNEITDGLHHGWSIVVPSNYETH